MELTIKIPSLMVILGIEVIKRSNIRFGTFRIVSWSSSLKEANLRRCFGAGSLHFSGDYLD